MGRSIDLAFADGTYRFALGLGQIRELQTKCGAGLGEIYARVIQGRVPDEVASAGGGHPAFARYTLDDLYEAIRQGLIGGGAGIVDGVEVKVGALRANELVARYLEPMPITQWWDLAAAVLFATVEGYDDPNADKKKAAPRKPRKSAKAGSTLKPR